MYANPFKKYYWVANDSILLAARASQYFSDTAGRFAKGYPVNFDSLVLQKTICNGNARGLELIVKNISQQFYKRIRLLQNRDSLFELFSFAPYDVIYNENNNRFFIEFRFSNDILYNAI